MYPNQHCQKVPELLKKIDSDTACIHAVCCHGYGICSIRKPTHEMEKILFTIDELTGLIWATAKMIPSKSTNDMELKIINNKFKDKSFASGCARDTFKKYLSGIYPHSFKKQCLLCVSAKILSVLNLSVLDGAHPITF